MAAQTTLPKPPARVQLLTKRFHQIYALGELVGSVGGVEIWSARHAPAVASRLRGYSSSLLAFDRTAGVYVGKLDLYESSVGGREEGSLPTPSECADDVKRLAATHGVSPWRVLVISTSFVEASHRNRGLGVAFYVAAAAVARAGGFALVADACTDEGGTSDMARRVWASKGFRAEVDVGASGLVGVLKAKVLKAKGRALGVVPKRGVAVSPSGKEIATLYHVTFASKLRTIAREGLTPIAGGGMSKNDAALERWSKSKVFLSGPVDLDGWYEVAREKALTAIDMGQSIRELGLVPVVLRIRDLRRLLQTDVIAKQEGRKDSYYVRRKIPSSQIEVFLDYDWDGEWTSVQEFASDPEMTREFIEHHTTPGGHLGRTYQEDLPRPAPKRRAQAPTESLSGRAEASNLSTYWHVTTKAAWEKIQKQGFREGGGKCGYGLYLWDNEEDARQYLEWEISDKPAVMLRIQTREFIGGCTDDLDDEDEFDDEGDPSYYEHVAVRRYGPKETYWKPERVKLIATSE